MTSVTPPIYASSPSIKLIKTQFTLTLLSLSLLGLALGLYQIVLGEVTFWKVGLLVIGYFLNVAGVTVGFHRYFAHKSFETYNWVSYIFAVLGSMAGQGSLIAWVSVHRCHHQYSDSANDPHSPQEGLWNAHLGWLLNDRLPNSLVFAKDMLRNDLAQQINRLYPVWIVLGIIIPSLSVGLFTKSWTGVLDGLIWGGLLRLFFAMNGSYIINSLAHFSGHKSYKSTDNSRNNFWLGILTLGEGWHNNHHSFPDSAKFGLKWGEIDLGYLIIKVLSWVGLIWQIKVPTRQRIFSKTLDYSSLEENKC